MMPKPPEKPKKNPNACPHCGDDRQVEWTSDGCFCNTCGRAWP